MLTYGGPVTPWRACYNMLISWQGTDWCAKSLYDWVTCMTRWPVWLGNLYDLYDKVTSLTRWPLSLGNLYDLHDQATSITGWLLWPACPSDIYDWVTSMTWWPLCLGDLHDHATCMTSMTIWQGDLYDLVTSMTRWLLWQCGTTPWWRLAPFLACSLPSYYYSPRIHKHSLTLACKHNLTLTEPDQCPRVHTHQPTRDELKQ